MVNERFFKLPEARQQAIINAGYRVFSRNSYKNSPMSEIADAAGISKPLLFHYFRNKKELYLFLWNRCAEITLAHLDSCGCYAGPDLFDCMGSFTAAFGMDRLGFGTLVGFYAIECGNILGLGGAFFASLCAVNMLSKEERDRTAEFLLSHPVSRRRVVTEKLAAPRARYLRRPASHTGHGAVFFILPLSFSAFSIWSSGCCLSLL